MLYKMALATGYPVGHFAPLSRGGIAAKVGRRATQASLGDAISTSKSEKAMKRPRARVFTAVLAHVTTGTGAVRRFPPESDLAGMTSTNGQQSRSRFVADELDRDNEPSDLAISMDMTPPAVIKGIRRD